MNTGERREVLNGQAIRLARLRLGLTQTELAKLAKVDRSNLNKAEHRNVGIGARKLPGLAAALQTTVDALVNLEEAA